MKRLAVIVLILILTSVCLPTGSRFANPVSVQAAIIEQDHFITNTSIAESIYGVNWAAQSILSGEVGHNDFQPYYAYSSKGRYNLDSIDLFLTAYGTLDPATVVNLYFYYNDSDNPGALVSSGSCTIADLGNSINNVGYTTFSMTSLDCNMGVAYWIAVELVGGDRSNQIRWWGQSYNGYLGKIKETADAGVSWTYGGLGGWDLGFVTYGTSIAPTATTDIVFEAWSTFGDTYANIRFNYTSHYCQDDISYPYTGFRAGAIEISYGETLGYELYSDNIFYTPYYDDGWQYGVDGSIDLVGLNPETHYYMSIRLGTPYDLDWTGGTGAFIWSSPETYDFWTIEGVPDDPTGLTIVGQTSTSIDLTWTPGSGADETVIMYQDTPFVGSDPMEGVSAYAGSGSSCTVTGLSPTTEYYFRAWSWKA